MPDFWTINRWKRPIAECDSWKGLLGHVMGCSWNHLSCKLLKNQGRLEEYTLRKPSTCWNHGNLWQSQTTLSVSLWPYGMEDGYALGVDKSTDIPFGWVFMTHYRYLKDFLRPTETTSNLSSAATPPSPSAEVGSCNGKKNHVGLAIHLGHGSPASCILKETIVNIHFPYIKQRCWSEVVVVF